MAALRIWWRVRVARLSVPCLLGRYDERRVLATVTAINGGLAIVTISLIAWLGNLPLLFAALGPTAFILFHEPFARSAAPRSVILGHLIGIATGYAVCVAAGWVIGTPSLESGSLSMCIAGSMALAITCALLVRFSCPHPPSCASALVVVVGGMTAPADVASMFLAVLLVTGQAIAINRLACLPVPIWAPRRLPEDDAVVAAD